jgi:hypothetical protein
LSSDRNTDPQKDGGEHQPDERPDEVFVEPIQPRVQKNPTAKADGDAPAKTNPFADRVTVWQILSCRFKLWLEQRKQPREKRERAKWTDIGTLILTFVVAGAGLWSAWIFQKQLTEARHQGEDAAADARAFRRHLRQEIGVAQTQARAAQSSAKAIQDQTQTAERAWMKIDVGNVDQAGGPLSAVPVGQVFVVRTIFQNTGHTPALDVRAVIKRNVVTRQSLKDRFAGPPFKYKPAESISAGVLPPRKRRKSGFPL